MTPEQENWMRVDELRGEARPVPPPVASKQLMRMIDIMRALEAEFPDVTATGIARLAERVFDSERRGS